MMHRHSIAIYWSLRSPYSYLALHGIEQLSRSFAVDWDVRVVYPLAIRQPDFFQREDPLWRPYLLIDTQRIADYLDMPFRRPRPDPIVQDPVTLEIAKEQPHIHRLTRLAAEATLRGLALPFIQHVGRMLWDGRIDGWDRGDHLARALACAGLDLTEMEHAIGKDPQRRDALIEENEQSLRAAGHWGVPTFVYKGEPFFGQDRLELLRWRLRASSLPTNVGRTQPA